MKIKKYFKISNLIENVSDPKETELAVKSFNKYLKEDSELEYVMYIFHRELGHLNDYCKAGTLRDYDVYVGGTDGEIPTKIKQALQELFKRNPKTLNEIKKWHITFEKIHPFGDGNGRTGRMLMLLQLVRNKIEIPKLFLDEKNFDENRIKYYNWFK